MDRRAHQPASGLRAGRGRSRRPAPAGRQKLVRRHDRVLRQSAGALVPQPSSGLRSGSGPPACPVPRPRTLRRRGHARPDRAERRSLRRQPAEAPRRPARDRGLPRCRSRPVHRRPRSSRAAHRAACPRFPADGCRLPFLTDFLAVAQAVLRGLLELRATLLSVAPAGAHDQKRRHARHGLRRQVVQRGQRREQVTETRTGARRERRRQAPADRQTSRSDRAERTTGCHPSIEERHLKERRRADSNRCTRLCRPLPNHSATAPPRHRSDPSVTPLGPPPLYLRQSNNRRPECISVAVSLRSLSSSFCWPGSSKTTNTGALPRAPVAFLAGPSGAFSTLRLWRTRSRSSAAYAAARRWTGATAPGIAHAVA